MSEFKASLFTGLAIIMKEKHEGSESSPEATQRKYEDKEQDYRIESWTPSTLGRNFSLGIN